MYFILQAVTCSMLIAMFYIFQAVRCICSLLDFAFFRPFACPTLIAVYCILQAVRLFDALCCIFNEKYFLLCFNMLKPLTCVDFLNKEKKNFWALIYLLTF